MKQICVEKVVVHEFIYTLKFVLIVQQVVTAEDTGEEGTYFVDQSGHYYYQASSDQQPVMTVVSGKN